MQPLVFWPRAGAFGTGAILELCAQLLWCELYNMKDLQKEKKETEVSVSCGRVDVGDV